MHFRSNMSNRFVK